ncbi:hypothetical protein FXN61_43550 [Lentzea sp. PSKA42]|jgi:hypothetical protein|uniref:Subtilisin inhibitor domain-containing protein n=1 Tax=Lentzea indica TaxID=2604800 RepID=A0ABX1FY11_9PSEU|nr:SSI family serine proteinase inhibitor [Lentzea indica]NKE63238.1 hypothetical protein [Lentzea indica]
MNSKRIVTMSALACAGLVFPLAGTAAAADGELTMTVTPENQSATSAFTLTCNPDGGNHPSADAACAEIEAANGDFSALPGEPDLLCTYIYDPVTVSATGRWMGQDVNYTQTFPNTCELIRATGSVFVPEIQ